MSLLSSSFGRTKQILKTRGAIWVTENIPLNRRQFHAPEIEYACKKAPSAGDCIEYPLSTSETFATVPRELYRATADFMRTDDYDDSRGGVVNRFSASGWKIAKGRVYSNRASQYFVISSANRILPAVSYRHEDAIAGVPEDGIRLNAKYFPFPEKYSGSALNLILGGGPATNIYHWMIDALPMLKLADAVRPLDQIDHFLVKGKDNGFRLKSLTMLGIDPRKIHFFPDQLIHAQADELIAGAHPRGRLSNITPDWVIDFHRENYLTRVDRLPGDWPEKIYVSRRDSKLRSVENEQELSDALRKRGFTEVVLSDYGYDAKIALFSHAREIVSMSGAGLAFLMYCQPGARVLEMFPAGFVHYANCVIATQVGLDYRYLIFGDEQTGKGDYQAQREHLRVDVSQVERALT